MNAVIDEIFHFQLAKKGVNVVLISRSEDKLLEVADEIGKIVFLSNRKDIKYMYMYFSLLSLQVKHIHFLMILGFPLRWWPFYDYIMFKKVYLCLHMDINFKCPNKNINFSHSLVQFLHTLMLLLFGFIGLLYRL